MGEKCKISLVVADVDGTLVTEQKVLTQRAQAAVQALHRAGIRFAITSGRPPRSMAMLFDALALETPIAGFKRRVVRQAGPVDPRTENGGTGHCPSGPRAHLRAWISTVRQMGVDG